MSLHVFDDLFDIGLHPLHLPVFFWQESGFLLDVLLVVIISALFRRWFHQSVPAIIHFFFGLWRFFLVKVGSEAEFVYTRSPISFLKVIIDVD